MVLIRKTDHAVQIKNNGRWMKFQHGDPPVLLCADTRFHKILNGKSKIK
jgi:hypothetical protein